MKANAPNEINESFQLLSENDCHETRVAFVVCVLERAQNAKERKVAIKIALSALNNDPKSKVHKTTVAGAREFGIDIEKLSGGPTPD
jgi:hypothetical protein